MEKFIELKTEIRQSINELKIVDTHEHLLSTFTPGIKFEIDLPFFLTQTYLQLDLVSSGMPRKFISPENFRYLEKSFDEEESEKRWKQIQPYLENVRSTIYYRYLLIAFRDLFGFDEELNDSNWKEISRCIHEKSLNHLKWAIEVLDKMKVHKVILNISPTALLNKEIVKDERLVQVVNIDNFIRGELNIIQDNFTDGKSIHSFDEYLNILDQAFETSIKDGAVGVKSALAYERVLFYDDVAKSDAEKIFSKGLKNISTPERLAPRTITQNGKMFEDFMMHAVCERCAKYNLPFQIHTGIHGGPNIITNSKPTHLTNLFMKYPDVYFDIFHGGYPYMQEAGILAKYFSNVNVDLCWVAHISSAAYKRGLDEWLEIVPNNKIFAWGGDHTMIEQSYASLMLAKNLVSEVLATKVASGYFSKEIALSVLEKIMGVNAIKFFKL